MQDGRSFPCYVRVKMHNFFIFPVDPKRAFCQLLQLLGKRKKTAKLINVIFENSSPRIHYGEKNFDSVVGFSIFLVSGS